ncbi:hypothetical protein [Nostoc sp.]
MRPTVLPVESIVLVYSAVIVDEFHELSSSASWNSRDNAIAQSFFIV